MPEYSVPSHRPEHKESESVVELSLPYGLISGIKWMSGSARPPGEWVERQTKKTVTWLSDTLRDQAKRKALFEFRGRSAQSLIDHLNHYLSHPYFRRAAEPWLLKHTVIALRTLCEASMLYPTCYVLSGVQDIHPQSGGGFCDISRGRYEGQLICLKVVRLYQKSKIEDLLKAHAREAILWSQLNHPNIVPFYGIFYLERKEQICLVSPWMKNGHIVEYLERVPGAPRKSFIYDIASGLQYLHAKNIVHGDLKGHNVLIDDHQNACLADFGLSTIATDETLGFAKTTASASGHTTRWAAPELLEEDARHTRESDVWAFGCVCYEVLTGISPFAGCNDIQALSKLMKGEIPAQLDNARLDRNQELNKLLCALVGKCWSIEAKQRPECLAILRQLRKNLGPQLRSSTTQRNPGHFRFRLRSSGLSGPTPTSTGLHQAKKFPRKLYNVDEELSQRLQDVSPDHLSAGYIPNQNYGPRPIANAPSMIPVTRKATANVGVKNLSHPAWPSSISSPWSQSTAIWDPSLDPLSRYISSTSEGDHSRHAPNLAVDAGYYIKPKHTERKSGRVKRNFEPLERMNEEESSPSAREASVKVMDHHISMVSLARTNSPKTAKNDKNLEAPFLVEGDATSDDEGTSHGWIQRYKGGTSLEKRPKPAFKDDQRPRAQLIDNARNAIKAARERLGTPPQATTKNSRHALVQATESC